MKMKKKQLAVQLLSVSAACFMGAAFLVQNGKGFSLPESNASASSLVREYKGSLGFDAKDYFDSSVVYKLPDTVKKDQEISVIVEMSADSLWDEYKSSKSDALNVAAFARTREGAKTIDKIARSRSELLSNLDKAGISYNLGAIYDTLFSGFEILLRAGDFNAVQNAIGKKATLIIGEEYEKADTQVVENDVNVYGTGIFDSSSSEYQGNGVVIAVLDTGLDYTHTAFSVDNFTTPDSDLAFTLGDGTEKDVSLKVGRTVASTFTAGLTGEDVYVNRKVPYAYDYADRDPDVLPINSEHGTHVAGIIAGKDDTITGVAPNAQLAIMKVFSDTDEGARTSWILSAVQDCVTLGVDVINMSLGSSCGFSREVDKDNINKIYDSVKEAGISLIAAASNDYNATFGSEKNGNLGLTSNPDSGTVGSPSTYDAALSVASISGVKTPYMLFGNNVIYFKEANDIASKPKNFVNEILAAGENSRTFEYVMIAGFGSAVDYTGVDIQGKIALVKRGTTSFEDKIKAATDAGAAGIIIYNNVSGDISMSVGAATAPACSISQDDGEMLVSYAASHGGKGTISISREQIAGPFMSDFSSWGPTSDLKIKPEITAHGGDILSAIPGQGYDKLSGTSMASPNQAGVTALIREYVKDHVAKDPKDTQNVTALVNQIMMSTADIAYNMTGLPYAVRKQGAGLANLSKATMTPAYITTFDTKNDTVMDKTKLELGDDKDKTGVYTMKFELHNIGTKELSYAVDAIVMTEGVSKTYTSHGETTVTEEGYLLSGAERKVTSVEGGTQNGNVVTVAAGATATVVVTVTLSDADKDYLNRSFENGMYVEGFVTLTAQGGNNVNLNVPFLAFYGDWTQAPIFDEEYYDTNADELDDGIDFGDKIMADAYATRVYGSLYSDYIATLGAYYFVQDPSTTQIAASKEKISLSNQNNGDGNTTINAIYSVAAGLLRNAKHIDIKVVEDSTGKSIFEDTVYNQRKSYSQGSTIYQSSIEFDFSAIEKALKNNTKYTVTLDAYIDYGADGEQNNKRSRFEFPLYIDFEAPVITDVNYRTVYDRVNKTTKYYADLSIYDNHYTMGVNTGYVHASESGGGLQLSGFGRYVTPVYSSFNSTSVVTIELTDYINDIKNSVGIKFDENGNSTLDYNNNAFVAVVYDYAMNSATYEIGLPDDIVSMLFDVNASTDKARLNNLQIEAGNIGEDEQVLVLSPNETFTLSEILKMYPSSAWVSVLDYSVRDVEGNDVAGVVNGTVVARNSGKALITARGRTADGKEVSAQLNVVVLTSDDRNLGYVRYDVKAADKFEVVSFTAERAFYQLSNGDRDIGLEGDTTEFGPSLSVSMYPSEQIRINYLLDSYFPDRTSVTFSSSRSDVASVDANGLVTAHHTANRDVNAYITVSLLLDGQRSTSLRIAVTVKNPFINNAIYLTSYYGGGDANNYVEIPDNLGLTTIASYAFSGYDLVDKDLENGDVINDEDPYHTKQFYLGNDLIKKIKIPEGITEIQSYAFANLTALEEVILPTTLKKIGFGAFLKCSSLKKINLENVQFINARAFSETAISKADFSSAVSFGEYAFAQSAISELNLPESCQSFAAGAFSDCTSLARVVFNAPKVKIGSRVFSGCNVLTSIEINAAVIPSYAFQGCSHLRTVRLGRDVAVIGEFAFAGTNVASFTVDAGNTAISVKNGNNALLYKGNQLLLAAPAMSATQVTLDESVDSIATGAFSGNAKLTRITANGVTSVGDYAFADCSSLRNVTMNSLTSVGEYAFAFTKVATLPNAASLTDIGAYAFNGTGIGTLNLADNATVGAYAFIDCASLRRVTAGDNVTLGEGAFYRTPITQVTAGDDFTVETGVFMGCTALATVTTGEGAKIGANAFAFDSALTSFDLLKVTEIGEAAFAATSLTVADLTNVEKLGENAFARVNSLTTVTFGDKLKAIPDGAFFGCSGLMSVIFDGNVTEIGASAFEGTSLESANLENIEKIGNSAFKNTKLNAVTFRAEGAAVGDQAFYNVTTLASAENLNKVTSIGNEAFVSTALTSADLSSAEKIGDFAFAGSKLTSVTFGVEIDENGNTLKAGKLTQIGENPFFGCAIASYAATADVKFNNQMVGTTTVETYDISNEVKVIDGAIYQTVPSGLQLASYPMVAGNKSFTVIEGTTRISDFAFAGSALVNVSLPSTLMAIGDKAFYGCAALRVVVFTSLNAPVLEETYDESYVDETTPLPYPGYYSDDNGNVSQNLGIIKYYMWNVLLTDETAYNNFFYGANFVNYVGRVENKLTMVRPVNGRNYDTFIMNQYFDNVMTGATAADQNTLNAIAAIAAIPEIVTLEDACVALVEAARTAYNLVTTLDQQYLVSNRSKLEDAEARIEYLRDQANQIVNPPVDPEKPAANQGLIIGLTIPAVIIVAGLIALAVAMLYKKNKQEKTETVQAPANDEEKKDE